MPQPPKISKVGTQALKTSQKKFSSYYSSFAASNILVYLPISFHQAQSSNTKTPLNYFAVFKTVQANIPKDSIIVSEGANTMDIGRGMLLNNKPRHRLDAGTFGTMGVSLLMHE